MALQTGTRLGPYEIVELRGRGGMGEVYRARDTRLDCDVAVEVLPADLSRDATIAGASSVRPGRSLAGLEDWGPYHVPSAGGAGTARCTGARPRGRRRAGRRPAAVAIGRTGEQIFFYSFLVVALIVPWILAWDAARAFSKT